MPDALLRRTNDPARDIAKVDRSPGILFHHLQHRTTSTPINRAMWVKFVLFAE
jgi:hypothetical protein